MFLPILISTERVNWGGLLFLAGVYLSLHQPIQFRFIDCNYLEDNCTQKFHMGRYIVGYTVGNFVKRDFRTYIRRYTSPNENLEYGYPHSNALLTFSLIKTVEMYFLRLYAQRLPAA